MYPVSDAWRAAIFAASRTVAIKGTIALQDGTVVPFGDADLQAGTFALDNQCVNGEELEFGAVYAGQLTMTLASDINRYRLFGGVVTAVYALQVADGSFEEMPLGKYWVTEANRKGQNVTLKALDAMLLLETDWPGTGTYGSVYELLTWICEACGAELGMTRAEVEALPGGGRAYQLDTTFTGACSTYRDLVAVLAQSCGCYATASREGRILLRQMALEPCATLPAHARSSTEVSDFRATYQGLKVTMPDGTVIESYDPERTAGLVMTIQDNPCFSAGLPEVRQQLADGVRARLCLYDYTPGTVSFVGDPAIECGDMLTVPVDGADVRVLVHTYTWQYRGRHTVKCVGKNPYLTVPSRESKRISQITNLASQNGSLVVTSQNIKALKLGADLKSLAKLRFITGANAADLVFNGTFLLDVTAEEGAVLSFVYELNGQRDTLHAPQQTVRTGAYTVTLFRPLMGVPADTNNVLQVLASTSGGTVTLRAYGGYATVYGSGLVNTAEPPWDGTITIEEALEGPWALGSGLAFVPVSEGAATGMQVPVPTLAAELLPGPWALRSGLSFVAVADTAEGGYVQQRQTISAIYADRYTYSRELVDLSAQDFCLRRRFTFVSTEQPIDAGRMSVLRIDTEPFAHVESIEVT